MDHPVSKRLSIGTEMLAANATSLSVRPRSTQARRMAAPVLSSIGGFATAVSAGGGACSGGRPYVGATSPPT